MRFRHRPKLWLWAFSCLFAGNVLAALFDADGDAQAAADTDGVLILRHLSGFTDQVLVEGAPRTDVQRDDQAISAHLLGLGALPAAPKGAGCTQINCISRPTGSASR